MGYRGAVASEESSGTRIRRGAITKTGNAHLRRVVIDAAWAYRHRPSIGAPLRKRHATVGPAVKAIAWQAQHRLPARYRHVTLKGKCPQQAMTAVGRELLGWIWTIDASSRQLPTDHDDAVSTRDYQSDQPSRQLLRPPPIRRHPNSKR